MKRLLLILGALVVLGISSDVADARPGGGHSYSGGSSGGGGGGGSNSGGGELVYLLIRLIIYAPEIGIPVTVVVIGAVVVAKRKNDGLGDWDSGESIALAAEPPDLDELREMDEDFSEVLFSDFVYALYAGAHQARSDAGALAALAPYLNDGARHALASREPAGQPVQGVVVGSMRPVRVDVNHEPADEHGNPTYNSVTLHFEANVTAGPPGGGHTYYVHERWTYARMSTARSRPADKARSLNCPNCDAAFESSDSTTCAYCGEVVNNGQFEWIVTGIQLMHQEARPPKLTGHAPERGTDLSTVWHPQVNMRLQAFQQYDPQCTIESIGARLALIYQELNGAWSSLDLAKARPFVSDGIYHYLSYWINAYQSQGLVNVLEGANITRWVVAKVVHDKHFIAVTVRLWASGHDYTMEQQSGDVVGGSKSRERPYSEYWTLSRGAEVRGSSRTDKQCPNCAAELRINQAGTCEFCQAHVTSGEFDWVLSKIEQDEAYVG